VCVYEREQGERDRERETKGRDEETKSAACRSKPKGRKHDKKKLVWGLSKLRKKKTKYIRRDDDIILAYTQTRPPTRP